jgi:hypothetical protein
MGVLKLVSDERKQLDLGEGDFLEVRNGVSKRQFRTLLDKLPTDWGEDSKFTPGQMDDFSTALFDMIVTGWSLDVPATRENYLELDRSAAAVVDTALIEHFNGLTPSQEERSKSKGNK